MPCARTPICHAVQSAQSETEGRRGRSGVAEEEWHAARTFPVLSAVVANQITAAVAKKKQRLLWPVGIFQGRPSSVAILPAVANNGGQCGPLISSLILS